MGETRATRVRTGAARWAAALALVVVSALVSKLGNDFIPARYPDRPRPPDLLFDVLPEVDVLRFATDAAILLAMLLLVVHVWRHGRDDLPSVLGIFAVFYTLRAFIMVLTPLALAHGDGTYLSLLAVTQYGNFPSGHAGAALLCYLLVERAAAPGLRATMLALAAVQWVSLILSRSHYSIDIVGGLLLAYFVWREWTSGRLLRSVKGFVAS